MASGWNAMHRFGTALYDFQPDGEFQIALKAGDRIEVYEESSGWYKGMVMRETPQKGIFPASFVQLLPENQTFPQTADKVAASVEKEEDMPFYKQKLARLKPSTGAAGIVSPRAAPPASFGTPAAARTSAGGAAPAAAPNGASASGGPPPLPAGAGIPASAAAGRAAPPPLPVFSATNKPAPPSGPAPVTLVSSSSHPSAGALPSLAASGASPAVTLHKQTPSTLSQNTESATLHHTVSMDTLYSEISDCMAEWNSQLQQHLQGGNVAEYHRVKERVSALLELRAKVHFEDDIKQREVLREEIIQLIEGDRKMQEGYMVPRNKAGDMADNSNTGLMELLGLHRSMYSTIKEESVAAWRMKSQGRRQSTIQQNSRSPLPQKRSPFPPGRLQLLLDVKMCIFKVGEATELFFCLWSHKKKTFVAEDFCVYLTDAGMPEQIKLLNKLTTLYKDLDQEDFDNDLYLVCFIYRRGRLVYDATKKKDPECRYRRPFGCAVLNLSTVGLETRIGKEIAPAPIEIFIVKQEESFPRIHQLLIDGDRTQVEPAPQAKGIALGLTLYIGDLDAVRAANPKLSAADVPPAPKFEFPEVLTAADARNDFYVFLLGGTFLQDNKTSAKNVEISIRVCDSKGNTIPDCLYRGAGGAVIPLHEYKSTVYYHNNSPVFNEVLRLKIDPEQFDDCHLLMQFWHVSTTPKKNAAFAFAYLKLTTESGAAVPDTEHTVPTFKQERKPEEKNDAYYLKGDAANPKLVPRKESFVVRTKLVSTKKTQNDVLHSLFKWRSLDLTTLKVMLSKFLTIEKNNLRELAKFIPETFDTFFGMLVSPHHAPCHEAVFQAVLHGLASLTDKKLFQYRPIVDSYISTLYKQPTVHYLITRLCKKRLDECKGNPDEHIMKLTKVFNYVVKLVVASRQLDVIQPRPSCDEKTFKTSMKELLLTLQGVVALEGKDNAGMRYLLASQSYIVRSFPEVLEDLRPLFSDRELGELASGLLEAIPNSDNRAVDKLNLIRMLLQGEIGERKDARVLVYPIVLRVLKLYLTAFESSNSLSEAYLCVAVLDKLLTLLTTPKHYDEADVWQLTSIMPEMLKIVSVIQENHLGQRSLRPPSDTVVQHCKVDLLVDATTALWSVFWAFKAEQLEKYIKGLSVKDLTLFANTILSIFYNVLSLKLYPEMWIVMNMQLLSMISTVLKLLAQPLKEKLGPNAAGFQTAVWQKLFELCLAMLTVDALKIEKFSDSKKEFILKRYGDIRQFVIEQVRECWKFLGKKQMAFTGGLVALLFDLALNAPSPAMNDLALDMYFDMIATEYAETKEFSVVERFTIDALYNIANISQQSGDEFMKVIRSTVTSRLANDSALQKPGVTFLQHVAKMYELMSSLLKFPGTEIYEDERTSVALKLMNYLEETGHVRKEMMSRYVQYLVDLHLGLGNFVEAGMTQLYQIKILDWSDAMLDAQGSMPSEPERARKERLYKNAINNFVQGEAYERAVTLAEQLRVYYQYDCYDYDSLANVLRDEASYFERIFHQDRFYTPYFRVVYFGEYGEFNDEIKGKEFVYRGFRLETVGEFCNRIRKKFPTAMLYMKSEAPDADVLKKSPQVIQIQTLVVEKEQSVAHLRELEAQNKRKANFFADERDRSVVSSKEPPRNVRLNRDNSDLICFSFSKPVFKGSDEDKKKNEFKYMWVMKTFLYTEESFPTNRRRVPVAKRDEKEMSPVESAVRSLADKTVELEERILSVERTPESSPVDTGPLSMILSGMVDAAVNGGTKKYIEAFLGPDFLKDNPDQKSAQLQRQLKDTLKEQNGMIRRGLDVFISRDTAMKGLADHLQKQFITMVETTRQLLS